MNPYEMPPANSAPWIDGGAAPPRVGPAIVTAVLVLAALVGFLSLFVPSIRSATLPRFGWIGLILSIDPLIFLFSYLWMPTRRGLMVSASMTGMIGAINAVSLAISGTLPVVTNEFTERLHSSWYWSVLLFLLAGCYLGWLAKGMSPHSSNSRDDEASQARGRTGTDAMEETPSVKGS
jgi:MFS family permease